MCSGNPGNKLSGGEKRRLYLMKILMEAPNVLVLDEPTNDIDIDTLKVLEAYIDDFRGPVITVSHDRYFLDRICNKIFHMDGTGNVTQYTGNYFDYTQENIQNNRIANAVLTENGEAAKDAKSKASPVEQKKDREKVPSKLSYKEKREFETIDDEINKLDEKLDCISSDMLRYATDYDKLQQLVAEKDQVEEKLMAKMERQEHLARLVEEYEKLKS